MNNSRVRIRYCKALFELAKEQNVQEAVLKDMKTILQVFKDVPEFALFLKDRRLVPSRKKAIFRQILEKSINPLSLKFLDLIVDYKREDQLYIMAYHYVEISRKALGIKRAIITTAVPLDDAFLKTLTLGIQKELKQELELDTKVAPELLGGFILRLEDSQLDASLLAKLEKIKSSFINA